jgi:hypothetical protein
MSGDMTSPNTASPTDRRSSRRWSLIAGGAAVLMGVTAVVALRPRGDDAIPITPDGAGAATTVSGETGPTGASGTAAAGPSTPSDGSPTADACAAQHAGHDVMHWSPEFADEMVAWGCAWPYDGFVTTMDGGAEDPAFDAVPFEGKPYADLTAMISGLNLGLCQFGNLPDPGHPGFVFGFRYAAAQPGCPGALPTVEMTVAEYSTRALRDAAALSDESGRVFVLGRWVIDVAGSDVAQADSIARSLTDRGAVIVL